MKEKLYEAMAADLLLLELEESLNDSEGRIIISGRELERSIGAARGND